MRYNKPVPMQILYIKKVPPQIQQKHGLYPWLIIGKLKDKGSTTYCYQGSLTYSDAKAVFKGNNLYRDFDMLIKWWNNKTKLKNDLIKAKILGPF
jgi:hypothetical protein